MSKAGRTLQIGDPCSIDYMLNGKPTSHTVIARRESNNCSSGILLLVLPDVPKSSGSWIDSDWFEPINIDENKNDTE